MTGNYFVPRATMGWPEARSHSRMRRRAELSLFLGIGVFLLCLWGYVEIAEDYPEGRFRAFDQTVLRSLRTPANPAVPRGPIFLQGAVRDISALGSASVLVVGVLGLTGYLWLEQRRRAALSIVVASVGGVILDLALKSMADRPRPEVVPHLVDVTTSSFPSGHTLLSAIIYLSVGTMVAETARSRLVGCYAIAFAALLTFAVGCSRIYLGVHFPTDVLASWVAAIAWTLLCVAGQRFFRRRRGDGPRPQGTS